ncbi:MAG: Flp pilus assembly protein CpaB [Caulobacterales bacterium]
MSLRQIIILAVALIAALGALVLVRATSASGQRRAMAQPAAANTGPMILVATQDIEPGMTAQASSLGWTAWPNDAANPAFIQQGAQPQALETFTGAVAREKILQGEPILPGRLVKAGDQGFFAAILTPGYRAVAVPITRETAVAGFLMPNDRVDVVLSRKVEGGPRGGEGEVRSDIVLENVRVLSVGDIYKTESKDEPRPVEGSTANLELSPRDVETLAMARKLGDIQLVLRGIEPSNQALAAASARRNGRALQQTPDTVGVRVHAFGELENKGGGEAGQ